MSSQGVPAITAARIVGDHSTRCAVALSRSCVVTRFWICGGELHPLAAVTMMQLPRVFSPILSVGFLTRAYATLLFS
jgi:hypothetical protein